jgi:DNA (cytosine-5)-methyltransferase 1
VLVLKKKERCDMKFLDLFSGIGGFRLAMEMAGHECIGHCEIDIYADKSYRAMHNVKENEFYANDIRTIIPEELPDFDCICGGFPCQSFSIAGKRGGFEDTRGTLFFEIARIISVRKPSLVFLENVAGLLSHDNGSTFETILRTLGELGYWYEYQVINGKNYLPQNRERVFIVGHLRGTSGGAVFPITGESTNNLNQIGSLNIEGRHESAQRVYGIDGISPALNTCGGGGLEPKILTHQISNSAPREFELREISPALCARDYKDPKWVKSKMKSDLCDHGMNGNVFSSDGLAPCISTNKGEGSKIAIMDDTKSKRFGGGAILSICPTLRSSRYGHKVINTEDVTFRIRKLTPLECFRLQGFTDEMFYKAQEVNSNSQLYKQAGNSVMVPCVYDIARRLKI